MDRSKVSAATPYLPHLATAPSIEQLHHRLQSCDLRGLGVKPLDQAAALSEQALRRAAELPETPDLDPAARTDLAASELLDDWLAQALKLSRPSRELAERGRLVERGGPGLAGSSVCCSGHGGNCAGNLAFCGCRADPGGQSRRHASAAD